MYELSLLSKTLALISVATIAMSTLIPAWASAAASNTPTTPNTSSTKTDPPATPLQTAVFGGGCFWGVDAVFKHVKGVAEVESGYAGGSADTADYEKVSEGNTGHAEVVRVKFNPAQVSYQTLLQVFFSVAHNPTELNRQGPDVGSQYRSAIFYGDAEQQKVALKAIEQLNAERKFPSPIVTQVAPLKAFYPAESYHQNYMALHPDEPYIVYHDTPKLNDLRKQFPALYQAPQR